MAAAEVEAVVHQLVAGIGREEEWDPEQFDSVVSVIPAFKFSIFLAVIESKWVFFSPKFPLLTLEKFRYARDVDKETLEEVEVVGEGRWLLHSQSKKVLKENTARARLARV